MHMYICKRTEKVDFLNSCEGVHFTAGVDSMTNVCCLIPGVYYGMSVTGVEEDIYSCQFFDFLRCSKTATRNMRTSNHSSIKLHVNVLNIK